MMDEVTTIKIGKKTRDRLASMTSKNQTYDDAINELMDIKEHFEGDKKL